MNDVIRWFAALGIAANVVAARLKGRDIHAARKGLKSLQLEAHRRWKERAFDLHPDRGGNEEEFKKLKEIHDQIQSLNLQPPRPQPQFIRIVVQHGGAWSPNSTTSTTGSTTYTSTGFF
jgi:hypothetical protein